MTCCTSHEQCDIVVDGEPPWSWRFESKPEPTELPDFEESHSDGEQGLSGMKAAGSKRSSNAPQNSATSQAALGNPIAEQCLETAGHSCMPQRGSSKGSEKPSAKSLEVSLAKQIAVSTLTSPKAFGQAELRGISLRRTLRQAKSFWLDNPHARSPAQKDRLYAASVQTKHLDMFISHTWQTKGTWKFFALLLQFGWPILWASWGFMVVLAFTLCIFDFLPVLGTFEARALDFAAVVPASCWIQLFGLLGILGGCLLFPHLPSKSDHCFLDFACICQTEDFRMQQGILSISTFLAASDELRVLWSSALLSRLWCVFELAAYRKVNPEGRIIIAPIKNETCACMMFLWWLVSSFGIWLFLTGSGGVRNPISALLLILALFGTLIPASAYVIWHNHKNSEQLRSQLANFDVMNVDCSNDFDRECIHDAIITWYGSLEAFSAHVQGPFSQEVLELMRVGGSLSHHYILLPFCPFTAFCLDYVLALCKAGAPAKATVTCFLNFMAFDVLFLPAVGIFFTWIAKRGLWLGNRRCKPLALEIGILLSLCICFATAGAFFAVDLSRRSLLLTLLWLVFACFFAGLTWRCCWRSA
eukprot:Skav207824  [mRNA]  locus=scaffold1099:22565:24325:- [translate_table: standard]